MSKLPQFKGLMVPTFTPFNEKNEVNYDVIEPYANFIKTRGLSAVLVNGTSGEGMSLSVDERQKTLELWMEHCKKLDMLVMVQISGCPFPDVVELTKHAASLKVDGILCLPELYFKPKTIEKLVQYLKDISVHCPQVPLYYYHFPASTQVDLPMAAFMQLAKKEICNFTGIKYTSGDLEKGILCLKHGQVFIGPNTILCGSLALGFENFIMTSLNLNVQVSLKIVENMEKGNVVEARKQQNILNDYLEQILKQGNGEWVPSLKSAFNKEFTTMPLGATRKPLGY